MARERARISARRTAASSGLAADASAPSAEAPRTASANGHGGEAGHPTVPTVPASDLAAPTIEMTTRDGAFVADPVAVDDLPEAVGPIRDGRHRRRQALLVVGLALASGLVGVLVGAQIKSPADEAAERTPPVASRITVPVERRRLESSIVLAGEVQYNEPQIVRLAGPVGLAEGETQVVTKVPEVDQTINEGDVAFEITGRPVFVLQGELPMYRRMNAATTGPDVLQLETALQRLGFAPGAVDNVFDEGTELALLEFYRAKGYEAEGPSAAQNDQLRAARKSVTDAETALRDRQSELSRGTSTVTESQLIQLRQALDDARAAVPAAQTKATRDNETATATVTAATTTRNSARIQRDSAKVLRDASVAPGAIDPSTGDAYTAERKAELESDLAAREQALAEAELALTRAIADQATVAAQGDAEIAAANDRVVLAEAQLREAEQPADTAAAQAAVTTAQKALDEARTDLAELEATIGVRLSPGEIVFSPLLPSTMTSVNAVLGTTVSDALGTLSTSDTLVVARVSRADSALVTVGAKVRVELRDVQIETTGTVASVGQPPAQGQNGQDGGGQQGDSGGGSGRLQVVILPDDPALLRDYVFFGARVIIDVAATDAEVLVVPVAALSVGPDGSSRVEVELEPVTDEDPGRTEFVAVEVGLTANGLVEVRPVADGSLDEGAQVVVGTDTGERRDVNGADDTPDDTPDDTADDTSGAGG
jgi:hypothetical protein